jgi:hypothetical protein
MRFSRRSIHGTLGWAHIETRSGGGANDSVWA